MRIPIPDDVAAEVLFAHAHTCCICNEPGKSVQIHHIDENNSNNESTNLAVLCLADHDATQLRGGFGRKLSAREVIKYRDEWIARVRQRKRDADKLAVRQVTGLVSNDEDVATWGAPSLQLLATYIDNLPDILKAAYRHAQPLWDTGVTPLMMDGTRLVIDVMEQSWVHLSRWFSPRHFGNRPAEEYFSSFIAARYSWNHALQEPEADGSRGTMVRIIVGGDTQEDIEEAVAETAVALGQLLLDDFDKAIWQKRWREATRSPKVMF